MVLLAKTIRRKVRYVSNLGMKKTFLQKHKRKSQKKYSLKDSYIEQPLEFTEI